MWLCTTPQNPNRKRSTPRASTAPNGNGLFPHSSLELTTRQPFCNRQFAYWSQTILEHVLSHVLAKNMLEKNIPSGSRTACLGACWRRNVKTGNCLLHSQSLASVRSRLTALTSSKFPDFQVGTFFDVAERDQTWDFLHANQMLNHWTTIYGCQRWMSYFKEAHLSLVFPFMEGFPHKQGHHMSSFSRIRPCVLEKKTLHCPPYPCERAACRILVINKWDVTFQFNK